MNRTSLSCQYTQPSIRVRAVLFQYRGLGIWSSKKSNELRAYSSTSASVAAIWPCSGGNQLYDTTSSAWWGANEEYSYVNKESEEVRLTC
jgi:hypothetical protein